MTKEINIERVWELFQLKGTTYKDVAYTLGVTVKDVRAALSEHAKQSRIITIKEIRAQREAGAERVLFNRAMPHLKDDEGDAWKAWLARSKLKVNP